MKYKEIRPELRTGDIVLFRGRGVASLVIRWFCSLCRFKFTMYSHVGMVVRGRNRVLLFEAVPPKVRHVALSDALEKYDGDVYIRQLRGQRTLKMLGDIRYFMHKQQGVPYEKDLLEFMGAATPLHVGKADNSDWFCSELVAKVYQMWGLIRGIPLAKEYCPDDFRLGGMIDHELKLFTDMHDLNGAYCLGSEIPIEK